MKKQDKFIPDFFTLSVNRNMGKKKIPHRLIIVSIILILFLWLLQACSKEPESIFIIPVAPPVTDTTPSQFGTQFGYVPDREDAIFSQVNMLVFSLQANIYGVIALTASKYNMNRCHDRGKHQYDSTTCFTAL